MAVPNITAEFIQRLVANGKSIEGSWPSASSGLWLLGGVVGGVIGAKRAYNAANHFRTKVRAGGDWDFKSNWLKSYKDVGVEIAGKTYRYDMPGNFHYGYTGAAAGAGDNTLFTQAGKAQRSAGTSKPEYHCTHGDDPEDYEFIRLGIKLYDDFGLKVTETSLSLILSGFKTINCGPAPVAKPTPIMPRVG